MSGEGHRRPPSTRRSLARFLDFVETIAGAVLRRRRLPARDFLDDAVNDGFEGLSRAFDTFEAEKGPSFEAYARSFISGAILDALDRAYRADPRNVLFRRADDAAGDFVRTQEISEQDHETPARSTAALRRAAAVYMSALSLGYAGAVRSLDPEAALGARREYAHALGTLQACLVRLAAREQRVLMLRTVEALKWKEVAASLGCSVATAQDWHKRALARLTELLAEGDITAMPALPDGEDEEEEE